MKNLTGISELSDGDIRTLLDKAHEYADALDKGDFRSDRLKGRVIVNMFLENSTRTRTSFERAALRLHGTCSCDRSGVGTRDAN